MGILENTTIGTVKTTLLPAICFVRLQAVLRTRLQVLSGLNLFFETFVTRTTVLVDS